MDELMKAGDAAGHPGPLPKDHEIYFRLYSIKQTLEWVLPLLIRTPKVEGVDRLTQLTGHRHYVRGPLHATLYP